jgi:hypothetical protein
MDQLCIDQFNVDEVNQEVPKMRQYYGNAVATLIAIDAEIAKDIDKEDKPILAKYVIEKVITSEWFKRS